MAALVGIEAGAGMADAAGHQARNDPLGAADHIDQIGRKNFEPAEARGHARDATEAKITRGPDGKSPGGLRITTGPEGQ